MTLWKVIIIAKETDCFVGPVVHILNTKGLDYLLCEDIYAATMQLTKQRNVAFLVIGSVHRVICEDDSFLSLLMNLDGLCCCILDDPMSYRMSTIIKKAVTYGLLLVSNPEDIHILIDRVCNRFDHDNKTYHSWNHFHQNSVTTEEEINALLGGYNDD